MAETHEISPTFGWTLQVDDDGDLYFDPDNRLQMIGGTKDVAGETIETIGPKIEQDMQILFKTMLGDNIFHANVGMDFVTVIASNYQPQIVEQIIKRALATYAFKTEIDSIVITDTRDSGGTSQIWDVRLKVGQLGFFQFQVGFQ